jgi:hypothetical protein
MEKGTWQMLPLAELTRPTWSAARKVGMFTLHLSLVIAVVLMVIKVIQLALRSQREERSIFFVREQHFRLSDPKELFQAGSLALAVLAT